jgi:DNA-binding IclR family transcriptional regulator
VVNARPDDVVTASGQLHDLSQTSGYRKRNSTADRALDILEMFGDERLVLSAAAVADHLGVARSTAYRYLQTLVQSNFLTDDGRAGFRLGMKVLQLSRLARKSYGLSDIAIPAMRALADRFHQTILLTQLMGQAVVCLEREESREQYVRLSYQRGTILNINAGASAQVLLAWLPTGQMDRLLEATPLQRFTDASITDPEKLKSRLAVIKADGYAISEGEVDPDAIGLAAPIFGSSGATVAAVSIVAIRSRVTQSAVDDMLRSVIQTAADLTQQVVQLEG